MPESNPETIFREFYGSIGTVNNVVQVAFEKGIESILELDFAQILRSSLYSFVILLLSAFLIFFLILQCTRCNCKKLNVIVINCRNPIAFRRFRTSPVEMLSKPF